MNTTNHFEHYDIFKSAFKVAAPHGLEAEFIQWMFQELKVTPEQLSKACQGALMEWDM